MMLKELKKKWQKRKNLKEAIKIAETPTWWIGYKLKCGTDNILQVQANNERTAYKNAFATLVKQFGTEFEITNISCL